MSQNYGNSSDTFYYIFKRLIDVVGATVLIILFSPIMLVAAILIKLTSNGPILADIPMRVGKDGVQFRLFKFRSMIVNAHSLIRTDPKFAKLYEQYKQSSYKISIDKDPRITKIGKYIRKYSIDEMPQFLNVLRGEMSIVGPRAYYPDELTDQQQKYPHTKSLVKEVLCVKPGITGYWQVSGRNEVNFDKRIEMDAFYARKRSILFDIMIILKTPWVMVSGKGAL
jgi:lipopolysaccharide/colanic/teichoic acid biosynthesis glycosyltransferase